MSVLDDDPLRWEERDDSVPFWRHAFAGSCAGVAEHVAMYPLDTVKTRMQAMHNGGEFGVVQTMRAIIAERGVAGLFRGATVIGAGCVPAHCGLFMTYELSKERLLVDGEDHQPLLTATCGAAGALVHDVVLTPHDVVKQRLQLGHYAGPFDCAKRMYLSEGLGGFYRSLPVTIVSNVPNTAVLAAVNESMKLALGLKKGSSSSELPWFFVCGGVAGAVASAVTLPFDVVKTRLQTDGLFSLPSGAKLRGVMDTVRGIARTDGMLGFYRGILPRMLIATPSAAMCWGTYESIQSVLARFDAI